MSADTDHEYELDDDEYDEVTYESAKEELDTYADTFREYMSENPKVWRFMYKRNVDPQTVSFLCLSDEEKLAILN